MSDSSNQRHSKRLAEVKRLDYKTLNNTGERIYRYDLNFYEYGNRSDQILSDSDNSDSESTTSGSTFK